GADAELVAEEHEEGRDQHVEQERGDEHVRVEGAVEARPQAAGEGVECGDHGDGQVRLQERGHVGLDDHAQHEAQRQADDGDHGESSSVPRAAAVDDVSGCSLGTVSEAASPPSSMTSASRRVPLDRAGTESSSACSQERRMPKRVEISRRYSPDSDSSNAACSVSGSPSAVIRYGGDSGRKSTSTAEPAVRIAVVGPTRWPLTATASAPAAHSPFTVICRSPSVTRLTVPLLTPGLAGSGAESSTCRTTPGPDRATPVPALAKADSRSAEPTSPFSSTEAWASAICPSSSARRCSSCSASVRVSRTSASSRVRGLSSAAASRRRSRTDTATAKPRTRASSSVIARV